MEKKTILYIHQHFKTPDQPGGTRSYWVSRELIKRGYDVNVLTISNEITENILVQEIDGIRVTYFRMSYNQSMSILRRLISFILFMFKSTIYSLRIKKVDLVFATSTPLTVGFPALVMRKLRSIPFIFEVRDLWPEVPIQMGAVKNNFFKKILRWFEKYIYENSIHLIALSPGMKDGILKYNIPNEKISVIPNMAKIDIFAKRESDDSVFQEFDLNMNTFKVIHFGSIGKANAVNYILDAAKSMKSVEDVDFIFLGAGSEEKKMIEFCKANELQNVHFLGDHSLKKVSEIVNVCDVSLVTFKNLPILYTNSPNKLFDSLSAQLPIIVNSNGWTRELVEDNECGFFVDPLRADDLVEKIIELKGNLKLKNRMGENARLLAETKFDKKILCGEISDVVDKTLNKT